MPGTLSSFVFAIHPIAVCNHNDIANYYLFMQPRIWKDIKLTAMLQAQLLVSFCQRNI
jgi:hypothetical protein